MNSALLKSDRQDWQTPAEVLDPVRQFCNGKIGTDPCSSAGSLVDAGLTYDLTRGEDGLKLPWMSVAFCNPPYHREQGAWIRRARLLWINEGIESVCLIPARPDTALWQVVCLYAPAICFWAGRITFVGAPSPAPFPSSLLYWGDRVSRFKAIFSEYGRVITT